MKRGTLARLILDMVESFAFASVDTIASSSFRSATSEMRALFFAVRSSIVFCG